MRRTRLDVLLTAGIVVGCVGIGAALVAHVDHAPSGNERRTCGFATDAERALRADAPFGATRHTIQRMAKTGFLSEDDSMSTHAVHARNAMHDYHAALAHAGIPLTTIHALPVRSAAATNAKAARFAHKAEADVQQTILACRRIARRS